jgi:hypothetical protein
VSIAYQDLKLKRSTWPVLVGPGGTLADYVPFYYAPRSPMLYVIAGGYVSGYGGGQAEVAHLVVEADALAARGDFAITDGHAATALTQQFDDYARLDHIDWDVMRATYWRDTDDDGDRKRRRQAEFLARESVPFAAVEQIAVMTESLAELVDGALADASHRPHIVVRRDWYY